MKQRPETDFARRRRLILSGSPKATPPPAPVCSTGVFPSAPMRRDLAPAAAGKRVLFFIPQATSPLIPSHV